LTLCTGPGTATVETNKYYSQLLFTKELLKDLSKRSPPCTPATNHTQSNTKSFVKWYPTNTRLFLDALHNTPPTLLLSNTPIDDIVCNYTQQLMKLATDSEYAKLIAISKDNNKKFHQKHTNNLIAWFDDDCKKMKKEVKIKLAAWRRNPGNQSLRKDYYDYRASWKRLIKKKKEIAYAKLNKTITSTLRKNPKQFWKLFKSNQTTSNSNNNITNDQWEKYFRTLHSGTDSTTDKILHNSLTNDQRSAYNTEPDISIDEIRTAIRDLKDGKSPGPDSITNEVIKLLPLPWLVGLQSIFNHILHNSDYPSSWAASIIQPIHKSGDKNNPSNYRGISLINCLGKLFTSIIGNRLRAWAEDCNAIPKEQFGFQKGKCTTDAIFVLNSLAEHQRLRKKRLYCCFVDFKKAFDSISHSILWSKLSSMNISPQILRLLKSYYSKSTACVRGSESQTTFFSLTRGVKQGCNLSPLLFSLLLNDLPTILHSSLQTLPDSRSINFPSSCLLFADDLVLFSENPDLD
jgi:hypothetical protein